MLIIKSENNSLNKAFSIGGIRYVTTIISDKFILQGKKICVLIYNLIKSILSNFYILVMLFITQFIKLSQGARICRHTRAKQRANGFAHFTIQIIKENERKRKKKDSPLKNKPSNTNENF